jgi:hypothetical protein
MDLRAEYPAKFNEFFKKQFMEVSIPGLKAAGVKIVDLPPADLEALMNHPDVKALSEGWVDWILAKKPELTKARAQEIQQTYLKLLDDYAKQYPDRLEP